MRQAFDGFPFCLVTLSTLLVSLGGPNNVAGQVPFWVYDPGKQSTTGDAILSASGQSTVLMDKTVVVPDTCRCRSIPVNVDDHHRQATTGNDWQRQATNVAAWQRRSLCGHEAPTYRTAVMNVINGGT
jgi:hypothetical protein